MVAPGARSAKYGGGATLRAVPDAGGTGTTVGDYSSSGRIFSRSSGRGTHWRRVKRGVQQRLGATREWRGADLLRFVGHAATRCQFHHGSAAGVRAAYSGRPIEERPMRGAAFGADPKKPGYSEGLLVGEWRAAAS